MTLTRFWSLLLVSLLATGTFAVAEDAPTAWPPKLPGANKQGTVTVQEASFLKIPADVVEKSKAEGSAPFVVAKTPPTVHLAYHQNLGPEAATRRLWSSWGDIGLASDGSVYCGIGDHHHDMAGDARCFIYRWDAEKKTLKQVVDMNKVVKAQPGQPAWSKVHAKIDEGPDKKIYFCCTLNDGNKAGREDAGWTKQLPGGQLYQYDPQTGKTKVFANLPPRRCTATSLMDNKHNLWWCNLEAGEGDALFALDMKTGKPAYQTKDGTVAFNRAFALLQDGSIIYNGEESLRKLNAASKKDTPLPASFEGSPGMRAATLESDEGIVYGMTHRSTRMFQLDTKTGKAEDLGANWLTGDYTTVAVLSPDQRFVYYMPGAHGKAYHTGTAVVQYDIAKRQRKVLAFLAPTFEEKCQYVPSGTYGVAISADGGTLYVNFNGHPADAIRPAKMKPIGFGLTSFAAIEIPESER